MILSSHQWFCLLISYPLRRLLLNHFVCSQVLTVHSDRERIMEILEHLEKKDLKKFKWLLVELKPIPKSELEDANICDLVDLMFGAYTQHTVEVTKEVFRKMNRNDLVQKLSDTSSRSKGEKLNGVIYSINVLLSKLYICTVPKNTHLF